MFKERHGKLVRVESSGHSFKWIISNFRSYPLNSTLNSPLIKSFRGDAFHCLIIIYANGDIGFYMHYKKPPIPKYSYYFINSSGKRLRQHTAHSIPPETERCGHTNACSQSDLESFLESTKDSLIVNLIFDTDAVLVLPLDSHIKISTVNLSSPLIDPSRSVIQKVRWCISNLLNQYLSPYTSQEFLVSEKGIILRIDEKPNTKDLLIFPFQRNGNLPPHSLVATNSNGDVLGIVHPPPVDDTNQSFQTLTLLTENLSNLLTDGFLIIYFFVYASTNPLDAFRMSDDLNANVSSIQENTGCEEKGQNNTEVLSNSSKKNSYALLEMI